MEDFLEDLYPEITLETDDILMSISVKKDYSQIKDVNLRKKEFEQTPESLEFIKYFDD